MSPDIVICTTTFRHTIHSHSHTAHSGGTTHQRKLNDDWRDMCERDRPIIEVITLCSTFISYSDHYCCLFAVFFLLLLLSLAMVLLLYVVHWKISINSPKTRFHHRTRHMHFANTQFRARQSINNLMQTFHSFIHRFFDECDVGLPSFVFGSGFIIII